MVVAVVVVVVGKVVVVTEAVRSATVVLVVACRFTGDVDRKFAPFVVLFFHLFQGTALNTLYC